MTPSRPVHYNPSYSTNRSRCGKKLGRILHTKDPNDATCNLCVSYIESDKKKANDNS